MARAAHRLLTPILLAAAAVAAPSLAMTPARRAPPPPAKPAPASIGSALMLPDGSIRMLLRAEGLNGAIGDALIVIRRTDPNYRETLRHLSGLKVGEEKPVPPWPDP